jgi:hypothetical protein
LWLKIVSASIILFARQGLLVAQSERPEAQVDPLMGNAQAIAAGQALDKRSLEAGRKTRRLISTGNSD